MVRKQEKQTFESDITRLEEISILLENEDTGLEKAVELFEEGVNLSKKCLAALSKAELKVTELKKKLDLAEPDSSLFEQ